MSTMPASNKNRAKDHHKQGVKLEEIHQGNTRGGDEDNDAVNEIESGKARHRPRKRKLYTEICKQLEFYFSDSNITKNRMMHDIVVSSEYVDLKKLLEFNKMQQMTSSIEDLQKALANSDKLVLSEDKTGVKRINSFDPTKLKDNSTIEECTIYVENVPKHVDHKWLETIFQVFGPIAYISLPKFKHNGQPKGFAFVEYESPEGSSRCLEAYGQQGDCLPQDLDPSELLSIQTYENVDNSSSGGLLNGESSDDLQKQQMEDKDNVEDLTKKRKLEPDEAKEEDCKRIKLSDESEIKPKDSEPLSSTKPVTESVKKSKKKRKQNKTKKTTEEKLESDSIKLRVMPKKKWRQLRSRYLNLQRENMSKLKRQLRQQFQATSGQNYKSKRQDNSYTNSYHPPYNTGNTSGVKPKSKIVKIHLSTPSESEEVFKSQIIVDLAGHRESEGDTGLGIVKYVDYTAGKLEAYIRLDADPSASEYITEFVQKAGRVFKSVELLSEKEGDEYWEFVRQSHKNKKQKSKKGTRGRDRLLQAASKSNHIHFDEGGSGDPEVETTVN